MSAITADINISPVKLSNMKIKSLISGLAFLFVLSNLSASAASRINTDPGDNTKTLKEKVATMTQEQKDARMTEMKLRVKEIKAMDKSQLTKEQKKALRQELRNMNKEAKAMSGTYVYVSLGGVIIIILLLILILR
jgi:hypothetical protein